jgi:hypothetical protein
MKSYSKMLLITALLSCVVVKAEEKETALEMKDVLMKPAHASFKYADKALQAMLALWITSEIVKRTPLSQLVDIVDGVKVFKDIESYIPGATDHQMVKKMAIVGAGSIGITAFDTIRNQADIRKALKKHCPKVVNILDKAMEFLGLVD